MDILVSTGFQYRIAEKAMRGEGVGKDYEYKAACQYESVWSRIPSWSFSQDWQRMAGNVDLCIRDSNKPE